MSLNGYQRILVVLWAIWFLTSGSKFAAMALLNFGLFRVLVTVFMLALPLAVLCALYLLVGWVVRGFREGATS
jgi:hypothetical protein